MVKTVEIQNYKTRNLEELKVKSGALKHEMFAGRLYCIRASDGDSDKTAVEFVKAIGAAGVVFRQVYRDFTAVVGKRNLSSFLRRSSPDLIKFPSS